MRVGRNLDSKGFGKFSILIFYFETSGSFRNFYNFSKFSIENWSNWFFLESALKENWGS